MSVIEKLWNGEIYAFEEINPRTQKYLEAEQEAAKIAELLGGMLDDEGKALLDQYHEALMMVAGELQRESYIAGVKLGANFILEVTDKESRITDEQSE